MKLLLDTHVLLWWAFDAPQLSRRARGLLTDRGNVVLVSAASAWELATKYRLGRLPEVKPVIADLAGFFAREGFADLPITTAHAQRAGTLAAAHRDPFDRMIAAQSLIENVPVLGKDPVLEDFGVSLLW